MIYIVDLLLIFRVKNQRGLIDIPSFYTAVPFI